MPGDLIVGSSLRIIKAKPSDAAIDSFFFGPDPWAVEVEREFKNRCEWESKRDLHLYFREGDLSLKDLVAGARLGYGNLPDRPGEDPERADRKHFYLVMSFGVQVAFQHQDDPETRPPRRWASVVMDHAEAKARAKERCVGMSLWVREENGDAQRFYANRHDFEIVRGPFEARSASEDCEEGPSDVPLPRYYEMRKRFADR